MRRIDSIWFVIVTIISVYGRTAQAQTVDPITEYVVIIPVNAPTFTAVIDRFEPDSIVLLDANVLRLAKKDIAKVIVHPKKEEGKGFVFGSILATYAGYYILGTADKQPGAFLSSNTFGSGKYSFTQDDEHKAYSEMGLLLLGMLTGGTLGFAMDQSRPLSIEFAFEPKEAEAQWEEVRTELEHPKNHHKNRISISGGKVFALTEDRYYDILLHNGLHMTGADLYPGPVREREIQSANSFNLLRSISISHIFFPNIDFGIAAGWFGEPSYFAVSNSTAPSSGRVFTSQRFDSKGYFLTGAYHCFLNQSENIEAMATVGFGLAYTRFDLEGGTESANNAIVNYTVSVDKVLPAVMVRADVSYYLYSTLSLGLCSNYFISGSETIGAIALANIPEQRVQFSNIDIGFILTSHF